MGRPREHGPGTRAALLRTAAGLLASRGVEAVTVRGVAAESGTSTRAVYTLFGGKEGLLRALFGEVAATMRRYHEAVPVRADPVQEIAELAAAYRAAARAHADLYPLYLGGGPHSLRPAADIAEAFASLERVLDAIRRAVASGRFPGRPAEEIGVQLWSLVHGLASIELCGYLGGEQQAARHWQDAVHAALAGYQQPPARGDAGELGSARAPGQGTRGGDPGVLVRSGTGRPGRR